LEAFTSKFLHYFLGTLNHRTVRRFSAKVECSMLRDTKGCYDELADHYHFIFENWESSMERQAAALSLILNGECGSEAKIRVLDCACGIGTQALGLAKLGFEVTATDLSPRAVARLRGEASQRSLRLHSFVADILDLTSVAGSNFSAVICMDNALPHLEDDEQLDQGLSQIRAKLRPKGLLMASIRDYDRLIHEKPAVLEPAFYEDDGNRRIVFQVWDWIDELRYVFHLYITREIATGWQVVHGAAVYRAMTRAELTVALKRAGFKNVRWLLPDESGFYQPVVLANG
jgi:glycine/sarcosine N-methyltransferase